MVKYLSGECTEEEKRIVKSWISEDQENQELIHRLEEIWDVEPKDEFQPRVTAGYQQVKKRLQKNRDKSVSSSETGFNIEQRSSDGGNKRFPHNRQMVTKTYVWAAAAVILLISVLSVLQYRSQQVDSNDMDRQKIETVRGERASYTLNDGSKVLLNADSKIEIASRFDTGPREVYLEGEAYFDIVSDQDRPFIIYSKQTYTRVVGTRFGISAYPDAPKVQTVVEEGRVLFGMQSDSSKRDEPTEINANEIAEVEEGGTIKQQYLEHPIAQYLGWKEGRLVFEKKPLRQIIPKLERWYNITIDLDRDVLGDRLLTATFQEESLTEVLNIISLSLDLNYTRTKTDKIVFSDISSTT